MTKMTANDAQKATVQAGMAYNILKDFDWKAFLEQLRQEENLAAVFNPNLINDESKRLKEVYEAAHALVNAVERCQSNYLKGEEQ